MQHSVTSSLDICTDEEIEMLSKEIFNHLIDEITLGACFEVHRGSKLGFLFLDETSNEEEQKYSIVDEKGYDIFGQATVQLKKQYECICPNCQRSLAAQRFAPHLEKCMGMGRNSSRIASKRIANATGKTGGDSDMEDCDNSADTDWNYSYDNKKSKRKKERGSNSNSNLLFKKTIKNNSRHNFSNGVNNDTLIGTTTTESNCLSNYENMSLADKKMMLSQICGVISEHTKKMCTRTLRCPQHTDEQRRTIRLQMLTNMSESSIVPTTAQELNNDVNDDGDSNTDVIQDSMYRLWTSNLDSMDSYPSDSSSNLSSKRKPDAKLSRGVGSKKSKPIKKGQQSNNQLGNNMHLNNSLHTDTSHYIV